MTFASLYCGAGGLDLGFIAAGFNCVAAFDVDAVAVDTYNRNLGPHAMTADLRCPDPRVVDALTSVDIVLAGPPCQGFSTAGRNDPDDVRNVHIQRVARLASDSGAKVILIENVRGLLGPKHSTQMQQLVRRAKAPFLSGCESRPATVAPAGSSQSGRWR